MKSPKKHLAQVAKDNRATLFDMASSALRDHFLWSLKVPRSDEAYRSIEKWLMKTIGQRRVNSTSIVTINDGKRAELRETFFDGRWVFRFRGHWIRAEYETPKLSRTSMGYDGNPGGIIFTTFSRSGRDALSSEFTKISQSSINKPTLRLLDSWGDWMRSDAPLRPMDTIYLPDGCADDLVSDLTQFLDSEERYDSFGIPWHRGYLFHGPPGTGKSSIAKGLAHEFSLSLYVVSLADLDKDVSLARALASIPPRSILLLEDIDAFHAAQKRTTKSDATEHKGLTIPALLNALDGITTPHGLITIMTTNHIDKLDPAILRAGRMDVKLELGMPDIEQASRMFHGFYPGGNPSFGIDAGGLSCADLTELLKGNMSDPQGFLEALELKKAMTEKANT